MEVNLIKMAKMKLIVLTKRIILNEECGYWRETIKRDLSKRLDRTS